MHLFMQGVRVSILHLIWSLILLCLYFNIQLRGYELAYKYLEEMPVYLSFCAPSPLTQITSQKFPVILTSHYWMKSLRLWRRVQPIFSYFHFWIRQLKKLHNHNRKVACLQLSCPWKPGKPGSSFQSRPSLVTVVLFFFFFICDF